MPTFYSQGFDYAISNGARYVGNAVIKPYHNDGTTQTKIYNWPLGLYKKSWGPAGSEMPQSGQTLGNETANGSTEVGQLKYFLTDSNSNEYSFFTLDGVNETGIPLGSDVTFNAGSLDTVNPGIAQVLAYGLSNATIEYQLRDGSGSNIVTLSEGNAVPLNWNQSSDKFYIINDLTFNNSTSGSWNVDEIRVLANSEVLLSKTGLNTGIGGNGGSITFTTLRITIDNLS